MGLDMYLMCNNQSLVEAVFSKRIEWGYEWELSPHRTNGVINYWRKANAIHGWFVDNVQNGVDDQGNYAVTVEQIRSLRDACAKVIAGSSLIDGEVYAATRLGEDGPQKVTRSGKVIEDASVTRAILPTMDGMHFGSADYDQDYLNDLCETRRVLSEILSLIEPVDDASHGDDWCYILDSRRQPVTFSYQAVW